MPMNKKAQSLYKWTSLVLFGCITTVAYTQDSDDRLPIDANSSQSLTLFEGVETAQTRGDRPAGRAAREGASYCCRARIYVSRYFAVWR